MKINPNIWLEIKNERQKQDATWGTYRLDQLNGEHPNELWSVILTEEVGEAAQEVLKYNDDNHLLRGELIQVAAVAVAWIEAIDRSNR